MTVQKAIQLMENDDDYDGILRSHIKDKYEEANFDLGDSLENED